MPPGAEKGIACRFGQTLDLTHSAQAGPGANLAEDKKIQDSEDH